jgi:hypothetical protein
VSNDQRVDNFESESSRLNEGLKICRAVMDNYRAMIAGEQPQANNDNLGSGYVSMTGATSGAYEIESDLN